MKSSINNNSNIISNYNSSREYDDSNKIISSKNYTLNEMTAGFDFFDNNKKLRKIKQINTKDITNLDIKKNINVADISNRTSNNLNKLQSKNSFIKTKNKTELNNEYHGENTDLFKNLYVNKQRKNKIKSFKMNIPDNNNNKIPIINNSHISDSKKNIDILEKINKNPNNNNSNDDNSSDDENDDSFISFVKAKSKYKKRNSINFIPIQFTSFQALKINIPNNNNDISDSRREIPTKKQLKKRGSEIAIKPKFQNNITYNKIVKSIFRYGKYKPKKIEEDSDYSSSDDSDYSDDSSEIEESEDEDYQLNDNSKNSKSKTRKEKKKIKTKRKVKNNSNKKEKK